MSETGIHYNGNLTITIRISFESLDGVEDDKHAEFTYGFDSDTSEISSLEYESKETINLMAGVVDSKSTFFFVTSIIFTIQTVLK